MTDLIALTAKLSNLSDDELLSEYDSMREAESIDYSMDGSGDCGTMIAKTWGPIWSIFEAEFEKRDININADDDMPA